MQPPRCKPRRAIKQHIHKPNGDQHEVQQIVPGSKIVNDLLHFSHFLQSSSLRQPFYYQYLNVTGLLAVATTICLEVGLQNTL